MLSCIAHALLSERRLLSAGLAMGWTSRPIGAVQGSILDGFGDVFGLEGRDALEVGDGAG